jgi:fatty-acyl-CoA synthase
MLGQMQQTPLLLSSLIDYAARYHGGREIVSRTVEGLLHRSNYATVAVRAKRLAQALERLGVAPGQRVATLAWNGFRHVEMYFGVTGAGRVLHTVNPRLFPEQIRYILNHADNQFVFFDITFAKLVESLAPQLPGVRGYVAMTDRAHMPDITVPGLLCYEELLTDEDGAYEWPVFDENTASSLCYTSGTTGNPKGVLYSHRSLVLHSFSSVSADGMAISSRDSILVVTPLFHVNAWGTPFSGAMSGAKLVLPGPMMDGESLFTLMCDEGCTFSLAVPTIWMNFLDFLERNPDRLAQARLTLNRVLIGGSAAPRAIIDKFERLGVRVVQGWGATETSPLAAVGTLLAKHDGLDDEAIRDIQMKQGRALYGLDLRVIDGEGRALPQDGVAVGDIQVRGPWVTAGYFGGDGGQIVDAHGWFSTGDVGSIDPDGYVALTDRSKDVIKSGGEWISSIALENLAVGHPDVLEAAVIGVPHPKWQERPLLLARRKPEAMVTEAELMEHLTARVAKFWLPDAIVFVETLPHTATGKLLKTALRAEYRDYLLQRAAAA